MQHSFRRRSGTRSRSFVGSRLAAGFLAAVAIGASGIAATPTAEAEPARLAAGPAWTCSTYGYLFQTPDPEGDHQLYQVDLVSGAATQIGTTPDTVNAVGYNTTDNYMYGIDTDTSRIVQIASDGSLVQLPSPAGWTAAAYNVGGFDDKGHYWVTYSAAGQPWYEIDYAKGSPTYGQILQSGTIQTPAPGADWTFSNGAFYSLSSNRLIKFDVTTHQTSDLGVPQGLAPGGFGAGYSDANGYLYFSDNYSGTIYRVNPADRSAVRLSTGPRSGANDGTRCATAPIPTVTVQKVVDRRATAADQFTVGLDDSAGNTLASVTTSGAQQTAKTTDWPVSIGTTYTITDKMASGSVNAFGLYTATLVCTDTKTGRKVTTSGTKGAWTLTVPGQSNYLCQVTNAAPDPEFTVVKKADKAAANLGEKITYTVTVKNTGRTDYTADAPASFTDDLSAVTDDATYNKDATEGAKVSGDTLTWAGPLAAGQTKTISYSLTVNNPATGDGKLSNKACADAAKGGDGCSSIVTGVRSFTVSKAVDKKVAAPGDVITYTITVTNTGKADYTDAVPASFTDDLSAVVDDATYNRDVSNGAVVSGRTVSWSGPLAAGKSTRVTYSFTVNRPATGDAKLGNVVKPGDSGGCASQDSCQTETDLVGTFSVRKEASGTTAQKGTVVKYAITVTNTGKVPFTRDNPATFTDNLSDVLDDAAYNDDASNGAVVEGDTLSWSGALAVGRATTITYSVTVGERSTGDGKLKNVVLPGDGGGCAADDGCVTSTKVTVGPSVGTGGAPVPQEPVWPWVALGAVGVAILAGLGVVARLRRRDIAVDAQE
jgi:uncharacterized repeat protein (TIGR01451 family)